MTHERGTDETESKSICRTLEGAWDEALAERGVRKAILVLVMLFMTVPFAPLWMLLVAVERAGYYDYERGFHL